MANNSNGYFFLSHSSKDIEKVRKIRSLIEQENGNPILFYLKCLDGDNPTGKDEEQLKDLISREIAARKKFILCKSRNTEPPLSSKWIEWEKSEVKKLQDKDEIQVHEVDIEKDGTFLQDVREIVRKQRKILLVAPYELRNNCRLLEQFLIRYGLHVDSLIEEGDLRTDIQYKMGCFTKDIVKGLVQEMASKSGLVILLNSAEVGCPSILQMASSFGMRFNCSIKRYDINYIDDNRLKYIYVDIVELINS